jgi:hypothetical protein
MGREIQELSKLSRKGNNREKGYRTRARENAAKPRIRDKCRSSSTGRCCEPGSNDKYREEAESLSKTKRKPEALNGGYRSS